jgi:hypothetical protein
MARPSSIPSGSNNVKREPNLTRTAAPDATKVRAPQGQNYGTNNGAGANPSWAPEGTRVVSTLGKNMEESGGDEVLRAVIAHGHAIPPPSGVAEKSSDGAALNDQVRRVSDEQYPAAHGMRSRTKNGEL